MPAFRQLPLSYASPEQLLAAVRTLEWPVLLGGDSHSRYAIAAAGPTRKLEVHTRADLPQLEALRQSAPRPHQEDTQELPFCSGWLGYFSYDAARLFEDLPEEAENDLPLPRVRLGYYPWSLVSDQQEKTTWLSGYFTDEQAASLKEQLQASLPEQEDFKVTAPFTSNMSKAAYLEKFARVQDYLKAGDCYQINLAQRFSAPFQGSSYALWEKLRQSITAPFCAFLDYGEEQLLSLSPERFLQTSADGKVETKPIKGTRPRGKSPQEDQALKEDLLSNEKDRAENLMIVDLLRNDLGRVCQTGSIQVPDLFTLESYNYVHHLVSRITGQLASDRQPLDLLTASFPGGSITGAPKLRAMQIIEELEPCRRSVYCGSIGYLDDSGRMDFNIAIRTFIAANNQLHLWGGGGLVADSKAEEEYAETLHKVARLIRILEPEFAQGI
ncbi:aminodeoxychorismate synthase component I [Marinospirillum perlucidum]|uniref:aminodeoxychorismate synthase component I n=1 Tax=Marinospirillum perlucidum TaxID=1982602 RepID=UPI000DF2625E|nr:aminodeoxychorismate synthase component I [Marinospirillum perlucidum]